MPVQRVAAVLILLKDGQTELKESPVLKQDRDITLSAPKLQR